MFAYDLASEVIMGLSPSTCADLIERFVAGRAGDWEWDDFLSVRQDDPLVEAARSECASIQDRYPADETTQYCNDSGSEALRELAGALRRPR